MKKQKHISIRIDADTLRRFHYVARYDDRSGSGQIMYLINRCIREFEEKHGAILLPPGTSEESERRGKK